MIVSVNVYYVILALIVLALFIKPLYARFIKKQGNKYDAMYLLIIFLLPVNWYTPKIISVTDCGEYKKEVVLFPAKRNGVEMGYGKNTFIFNDSDKKLILEYHFYGKNTPDEDEVDAMILPGNYVKINRVGVDHIFETLPDKVSSKSGGATKTSLRCE
ncbi:MAG: hypothetical protein LBV74_10875 [Tannerella sp.]|jgi:energy-coupling factor transporter transmembrane protein EcfT|nr:hypothetical protein [Tannerella sp.]